MGSVWPVPTWNLRAPARQSLQWASTLSPAALPAELSASVGVGVTLSAMVGDQSLRKRWWGEFVKQLDVARLGRDRVSAAGNLFLWSPHLAVARAVAQARVADARELVGEGAGGLVVVASRLDGERPATQPVDRAVSLGGGSGRAKHRTCPMGE